MLSLLTLIVVLQSAVVYSIPSKGSHHQYIDHQQYKESPLKNMIPRSGCEKDVILISVLDSLLDDYFARTPDAQRVVDLFQSRGDTIINDHIAFRCLHQMDSLLKIFIHLGYEVRMNHLTGRPFNFEKKKLTAVWLKHANETVPRIFLSHFRASEASERLKALVFDKIPALDNIDEVDMDNVDAILQYLRTSKPTSSAITFKEYLEIQSESEYVAWVLCNGYSVNHFTLQIHQLDSFDFTKEINEYLEGYRQSFYNENNDQAAIESLFEDAVVEMKTKYKKQCKKFNEFLLSHDYNMNTSGDADKKEQNVINIAPDGLLLQSSTKSQNVTYSFIDHDEDKAIPGSYVEFAYRGFHDNAVIDFIRGDITLSELYSLNNRRDGFETQNANQIFESTFTENFKNDPDNAVLSMKHDHDDSLINDAYNESCQRIDAFLKNCDVR